ncbi:MAG TPA: hypothetical protein VNC79_04730 [Mycobacteriales bacterium]|jgi:hypothetical protein|nr:hypothetical protein [Mycobacteriales bacterium]
MRKRLVRAIVFIAVAIGVAVGAANAAGALDLGGSSTVSTDGINWD